MQKMEISQKKSKKCETTRATLPKSKSYLAQIALAIKYLNENKILHRDIKLNNILIDESGL